MAQVFFLSGITKIKDFESTLFLFQYEYSVPFVSPWLSAVSATGFELLCPVLLVLGVATRLSVLPLLAMTLIIEFTYQSHTQHYYWLILLLGLLVHGAGMLSVDHLLKRRFK
jgi:putative oxidoreductase